MSAMDAYWQGDVAVVGGGPAGATAARRLAEAGLRVAIVERADLPRYKTCGGGLVGKALRLLPPEGRGAIERACDTAELNVLDAGLHFVTRRDAPIVGMTMRAELDHRLVQRAQRAGADLLSPCAVAGVELHDGHVMLDTLCGQVRAAFVIAADGANSLVARRLRWPDGRVLAPALECEIGVGADVLARFGVTARFDFGVVPTGYAWVFPKRGHLSVGVLSMRRGRVDLNAALARYLDAVGLDRVESIERHGYTIPVTPRQGPPARGRVLLVGDAVGLADPVTAEGISNALMSGAIAAESLIDSGLDAARTADAYADKLARTLLPELKAARRLAQLLYFWPRLRNLAFRVHGQRLCEAMTDVIAGERTFRQLVRAGNYWRALRPW
jgi:geranylgeranyl reductase family protein